jgi:hypothetical protein
VTNPPDGRKPGRPPVLDDDKRRTIIAMLTNGSSARVAAAYVGCAPTTIARTAGRDPDFAAELARAQQNAEIEALRFLRKAARKDRYWRAAAWLLERRNPDDFARREPNVITEDQLRQVLASTAGYLLEDLSEEKYEGLMRRLDQLRTLVCKPQAECDTPSTAGGFAPDTTTELDNFGDDPWPQLTANEADTEISDDATETAI